MCADSVGLAYLDETNVGALLAEALTANVEAVLANETGRVGADAAVHISVSTCPNHPYAPSVFHFMPMLASGVFLPRHRSAATRVCNGERHTTRGSPCRRCAGASTRRIRETWCVVERGGEKVAAMRALAVPFFDQDAGVVFRCVARTG